MPLLRYFVFVGSALLGLIYLVGSVLPHDTRTHLNSKSEVPLPPRQPKHTAVPSPRTAPSMSFAAVPDGRTPQAGEPLQESAPAAKDTPPRKKRKSAARKQEWQDSFAQADGWRRDQRSDRPQPTTKAGATLTGATKVGATEVAIRFGARTGAARAGVDSPPSRQSLGRYPNAYPLGMIGIVRDA
jgi:hypothetical protein